MDDHSMMNNFDFAEALKTLTGREVAIHMVVAYMVMLTSSERLQIMSCFCIQCGAIYHIHPCLDRIK
jgi:hypothetical protein